MSNAPSAGDTLHESCHFIQRWYQIQLKERCVSRADAPGLMIIGPEGDFTMAELQQLTAEGARLVGLGPHRLRVETAALAMLSAAQLLVA